MLLVFYSWKIRGMLFLVAQVVLTSTIQNDKSDGLEYYISSQKATRCNSHLNANVLGQET